MNNQVYGYVTERIAKLLEAGTVPWKKPWFGVTSMPRNLVSGKPYRGINVFLLHCAGYESPYFLSAKQVKDRGGFIRKGEKGNMVVWYNLWTPKNAKPDEKGRLPKIPILRYYNVWNVAQCDGIDYPKPEVNPNPVPTIDRCEALWNNWQDKPEVKTPMQRACYNLRDDVIDMPMRDRFTGSEEWYSTLYHEGIHATGHSLRLNRDMGKDGFGSGSYAQEELVAEFGAAFLCGHVGIETKTIENSAAYIQNWLQRLAKDATLVVKAAGKAQYAADYILNGGHSAEAEDAEAEDAEKSEVTA